MKRTSVVVALVMLMSTAVFGAEKWTGWLVDNACSGRMKAEGGVEKAKAHSTKCALMPNCEKSGYALVVEDGKVYKLDAAGNAKAVEIFKATKSDKGLNATVEGTLEGDTIKVTSLSEATQ